MPALRERAAMRMTPFWMGAALAFFAGCTAGFGGLPEQERARFAQCEVEMRATCAAGDAQCEAEWQHEYAERSTEHNRQLYLVRNGCSPAIAGISGSGGEGATARPGVVASRR